MQLLLIMKHIFCLKDVAHPAQQGKHLWQYVGICYEARSTTRVKGEREAKSFY